MSGIAEVLLSLGYKVSGSDIKKSDITDHLKKLGARIYIGHKASNIKNADVVVTSTAVNRQNPEVLRALEGKIPVIPRVEMLAELARLKYTVTIAGTHGKTTTTSLTSLVLEFGGLDPTMVIGGRFKNIKSGAKLGRGEFLVAEADESDGSFLKLSPTIAVATNIDNDHLDYYGTLENIKLAFEKHLNSVPFYGCAILCVDDPVIAGLLPQIKRRYNTYGFNSGSDFSAGRVRYTDGGSQFSVSYKNKKLGNISLNVPGRHNILNSLAAIAVGHELGIPFSKISAAIRAFDGVGRRLEKKGEKNGIMVLDDYAHHPTEIRVTIDAVKKSWPKRRLVVLFQPHRYSRTAHLHSEFGAAFANADEIRLMEIYAAGEKPQAGVTSRLIFDAMLENGRNPQFFQDSGVLSGQLKKGDILLTLGAGDVWKTGEEILKLI